ncbi:MAG TPA: aminodeoxychorismate lyase, partial [Cellvibrio sp.]|nr:aminodeoxychorismate lyase [Cellvibrio sp.]
LAPAMGLDVDVVDMDLDFISTADEIFLCNSVYGIWPVNNVVDDLQETPQQYAYLQHRITQTLQQQLERFLAYLGGS